MIIAGAGGAAHLPGMLASVTPLPVIGVPVPLKYLDGMDSLLSIVQMPAGIPVATVAIGNARNAGILAARILGASDAGLQQRDRRVPGRAAESATRRGPSCAGGGGRAGVESEGVTDMVRRLAADGTAMDETMRLLLLVY